MDLREFTEWFEEPINRLEPYPHSGFAFLMLVMPLAERLFRERSGIGEQNLNDAFYAEFGKEFPNLILDQPKQLWHILRNGLLHYATFSRQNRKGEVMPYLLMTAAETNTTEIVAYYQPENIFIVKPLRFARKILEIVKADLTRFAAPSAPNHPTAQVTPVPQYAQPTHPFIGQQASATGCAPQQGATGHPGFQPPPNP